MTPAAPDVGAVAINHAGEDADARLDAWISTTCSPLKEAENLRRKRGDRKVRTKRPRNSSQRPSVSELGRLRMYHTPQFAAIEQVTNFTKTNKAALRDGRP